MAKSLEACEIFSSGQLPYPFVDDFRNLLIDDFAEQAAETLDDIVDFVKEVTIPNLDDFHGIWNPTGFMVYDIGVHSLLGFLELHVWPGDLQRIVTKDMGHDHMRHIASLVLAGTYSDMLLQTCPVPPGNEEVTGHESEKTNKLYHAFTISPDVNAQTLHPRSQAAVSLKCIGQRTIDQGSQHFLEATTFHRTTIDEAGLVATLSFNSLRVNKSRQLVILDKDPVTFSEPRIHITVKESQSIKKALMAIV